MADIVANPVSFTALPGFDRVLVDQWKIFMIAIDKEDLQVHAGQLVQIGVLPGMAVKDEAEVAKDNQDIGSVELSAQVAADFPDPGRVAMGIACDEDHLNLVSAVSVCWACFCSADLA